MLHCKLWTYLNAFYILQIWGFTLTYIIHPSTFCALNFNCSSYSLTMQKHISVVRSFLNCVGIVTSVFGKTIIHKEHIPRLDRLGLSKCMLQNIFLKNSITLLICTLCKVSEYIIATTCSFHIYSDAFLLFRSQAQMVSNFKKVSK